MLVVVAAATGTIVATLRSEGCRNAGGFGLDYSPDGQFFALANGTPDCGSGGSGDPAASWVDVYDTETWQPFLRHSVEGARNEVMRFSADSSRVLVWYGLGSVVGSEVLTFPDRELRADVGPQRFGTLSPSGFAVAYDVDSGGGNWPVQLRLLDVASGTVIPVDLGGVPEVDSSEEDALLFSPDGSLLAVVGDGRDAIVDPSDGSLELRLYGTGPTYESWWSADGTELLTSHDDEILLWAIVQDPGRIREALESGDWVGFAQDQLVRGFTPGECLGYDIDPCPSLEEMRSR